MRAIYIWQQPSWTKFKWDNDRVINLLSQVRNLEGRVLGLMSALGFNVQNETSLDVMVEDVLRSSEIEGELLNADRVRSSNLCSSSRLTCTLQTAHHNNGNLVAV